MTDLTHILNAVIALLAALVTAFVIPWLKRKTSAQEREELLRWVLSFQDQAELLEPEELRRELGRRLKKFSEKYDT